MQKSNINPEIVDELFASAVNAADKGQSQCFTPLELARSLAEPLPPHRPIICDLTCGHGALLLGAANATTKYVLGADIDNPRVVDTSPALGPSNDKFLNSTIQHDLTLLYPMLRELELQADLFVLNPPWGLCWHRDRLVREAFKSHDTMGKETIDSTIATLMIALDLMSCPSGGPTFGGRLIGSRNLIRGSSVDNRQFNRPLPHHLTSYRVDAGGVFR